MRTAWRYLAACSLLAACGGGGGGAAADAGVECPPADSLRPTPRADAMGVYDPTRARLVFYGGDDGAPVQCNPAPHNLDELWLLDPACALFEPASVEGGPGGRARGLAVLDSRRDRMLVFGGRFRAGASGPYAVFADVWSLDLATLAWERLATSGGPPPARSSTAGGYDPIGDRLVVFGGNASTDGARFSPLGDLWLLDLATLAWTELVPQGTPPEARLFHAGAVDGASGRLFVHGGGDANAFFGPFFADLWAVDLASGAWTQLDGGGAAAPRGRINGSLVVDAARARLVLFGGHDDGAVGNNNDTWAFDLGAGGWSALVPPEELARASSGFCDFPADFTAPNLEAPERRSAQVGALDEAAGVLRVLGGKTDCGIIDDVWRFELASDRWSRELGATAGESCVRQGGGCTSLCF